MASIVYVTRDIERAMGKLPGGDYHIITNKTPYAEEIKKEYPYHVLLVDSKEILDTYEILIQEEVQKIINDFHAHIIVFKNTIHIEALCKEKNWTLLNPSAELSEKIENKITQVRWLDELSSLLPTHKILETKDVVWDKKPFVLQWSHGHTGDGTLLIQNENDLNILKKKFPHRETRITDFIKGPMFTINIVVSKKEIFLGNISYQITGILPFTENPFSTIGNDWSVPFTILSENHIEKIKSIAEKVAGKMKRDGWLGLFGIDVIYDEERDEIHLIEINARQPASTTFESELQRNMNIKGMTIFEAHLNSLLNIDIENNIIPINDGAQILQRVTSKIKNVDPKKLINANYKVISYLNTEINSDLLRIQSNLGIMEVHNKFNKRGKEINQTILIS